MTRRVRLLIGGGLLVAVSLLLLLQHARTADARARTAFRLALRQHLESGNSARIQAATILRELPHDPDAYTQGLLVDGGRLLESTGRRGKSDVRAVTLETGELLARVPLDDDHWGEGLARHGDRLYQLTWKARLVLLRDPRTLAETGRLPLDAEGWGVTSHDDALVTSDGSATLTWRDPATLAARRTVTVRDGEVAVSLLNELEVVGAELWANVWKMDLVVRIDPATGAVLGWLDLSPLRERLPATVDGSANGIAYDPATRRVYLTGKLWPTLFEVALPR